MVGSILSAYWLIPPSTLYTSSNPWPMRKVATLMDRIPTLQRHMVGLVLSNKSPASTFGDHEAASPRGKLMMSAPVMEATASSLGSLTSTIWYDGLESLFSISPNCDTLIRLMVAFSASIVSARRECVSSRFVVTAVETVTARKERTLNNDSIVTSRNKTNSVFFMSDWDLRQ